MSVPLTAAEKRARGTDIPSRPSLDRVVTAIDGDPVPPASIKGAKARKLWAKKVSDLTHRGIALRGSEELLAAYVMAYLDWETAQKRGTVAQSQLMTLRALAVEFFDSPASQYGRTAAKERKGNKFAANGKASPPRPPPGSGPVGVTAAPSAADGSELLD